MRISDWSSDVCSSDLPTPETIADNSYPVSRPLFIYVNKAKAEENPALAAWVDHYLGEAVSSVSEVSYVDLAPEDLDATVALWEARKIGRAPCRERVSEYV